MSCDNNPNILRNNCQLIEGCSDIQVNYRVIDSKKVYDYAYKHILKVPRLIASVALETFIVDDVTIPEGFSEIKSISKKVIINQTKLVKDHLIVEGYILKNISYVTPDPVTTDTGSCIAYRNTWRDIEVKVPFSIGTRIEHSWYPEGYKYTSESPVRCNTMKNKCCDQGYMGESLCESERSDHAYLAEVPHFDLEYYSIKELDINRKPCVNAGAASNLYEVFTEKLLVYLEIDILVDDYVWYPYPCLGQNSSEVSKDDAMNEFESIVERHQKRIEE